MAKIKREETYLLNLTKDEKQRLSDASDTLDMTMAELVREAIAEYLYRNVR